MPRLLTTDPTEAMLKLHEAGCQAPIEYNRYTDGQGITHKQAIYRTKNGQLWQVVIDGEDYRLEERFPNGQ